MCCTVNREQLSPGKLVLPTRLNYFLKKVKKSWLVKISSFTYRPTSAVKESKMPGGSPDKSLAPSALESKKIKENADPVGLRYFFSSAALLLLEKRPSFSSNCFKRKNHRREARKKKTVPGSYSIHLH